VRAHSGVSAASGRIGLPSEPAGAPARSSHPATHAHRALRSKMAPVLQRIRDLPDQGLYGVIGVLAVAALYVIGFVIKNSKNVSVDFVLFSAGVPLITLMVVMLLFGALLGIALTLMLARRRAPSAAPSGSTPPPVESPVTPPPPPPV
jgi:uncharacterized integral membrane protein